MARIPECSGNINWGSLLGWGCLQLIKSEHVKCVGCAQLTAFKWTRATNPQTANYRKSSPPSTLAQRVMNDGQPEINPLQIMTKIGWTWSVCCGTHICGNCTPYRCLDDLTVTELLPLLPMCVCVCKCSTHVTPFCLNLMTAMDFGDT